MKIGNQVLNIIITINCLPLFQQQSLLVVLSDYWITSIFKWNYVGTQSNEWAYKDANETMQLKIKRHTLASNAKEMEWGQWRRKLFQGSFSDGGIFLLPSSIKIFSFSSMENTNWSQNHHHWHSYGPLKKKPNETPH